MVNRSLIRHFRFKDVNENLQLEYFNVQQVVIFCLKVGDLELHTVNLPPENSGYEF